MKGKLGCEEIGRDKTAVKTEKLCTLLPSAAIHSFIHSFICIFPFPFLSFVIHCGDFTCSEFFSTSTFDAIPIVADLLYSNKCYTSCLQRCNDVLSLFAQCF